MQAVTKDSFLLSLPDCQLDCIWKELQSRNGGNTCDMDPEAGRQHDFVLDLEAGRYMHLHTYIRNFGSGT